MSSKVRIIRRKNIITRKYDLNVMIDAKSMGSIKDGETCEFNVEPGSHEIYTNIEKIGYQPVKFYLEENSEVVFTHKIRTEGIYSFTILETDQAVEYLEDIAPKILKDKSQQFEGKINSIKIIFGILISIGLLGGIIGISSNGDRVHPLMIGAMIGSIGWTLKNILVKNK